MNSDRSNIRRLARRDLNGRRMLTVDLPEFLVCALEQKVTVANAGAAPHEQVTLDQVVEMQLAENVSLAEVALLEHDVPGITTAVSNWLATTQS